MLSFSPSDLPVPQLHQYLLGAVAPRPVAFVSTCDAEGRVNLSPFSFFNVFGSRPPILVFSPAKSGRTGATKNTFDNVKETGECVVNIINHALMHQTSLASGEYPKGVNEFIKAGFTELASEKVRPPRVKEAPVQMECKVLQIIETGELGGAGNLVICEVLHLHIREEVLDEQKNIDPYKMDYVARMGKNYWCHVIPESIVDVPAPATAQHLGIGYDGLPSAIRNSDWLSGNEIAQLASVTALPAEEEMAALRTRFSGATEATVRAKVREWIANRRYPEALGLLMI